jgi:hypothetical protein
MRDNRGGNKPKKNDQAFIQEIITGLEEATPHIERCAGATLVMAIGMTGRGKSTLTRYLMNAPLRAVSKGRTLQGVERIVLTHPDDPSGSTPIVGQSTTSQTVYPATYSLGKPYLFADTGGLFDTRGAATMTVINLANDMMIRNVEGIKGIVVVVDVNDLIDQRAVLFSEALMKLWSLFKDEVARNDTSWQSSVRLVVTKMSEGPTSKDVCDILKQLLTERMAVEKKNPGSIPYLPLLEAFAKHPEKIFCFPAAAVNSRACANQWLESLDLMPGINKDMISNQANVRDHANLAIALGGVCADFNTRFGRFNSKRKELSSLQENKQSKEEELSTANAELADIKNKKTVDRNLELAKLKSQKKRLDRKIKEAKEEGDGAKAEFDKIDAELTKISNKLDSTPSTKEIPGGEEPTYTTIAFVTFRSGTRKLPPVTVVNDEYLRLQSSKGTLETKKMYQQQNVNQFKQTISTLSDNLSDIEGKLEFLVDNPDANPSHTADFFSGSINETIKRLTKEIADLNKKIRENTADLATYRSSLVAIAPSCNLILKLDDYLELDKAISEDAIRLMKTDDDLIAILTESPDEPSARASRAGIFGNSNPGGGGSRSDSTQEESSAPDESNATGGGGSKSDDDDTEESPPAPAL